MFCFVALRPLTHHEVLPARRRRPRGRQCRGQCSMAQLLLHFAEPVTHQPDADGVGLTGAGEE